MESFVFRYHFIILSIINISIFYNLNITLKFWLVSKFISVPDNFILKMPRGSLLYLLQSEILLFIFLVITTFEVTSCILLLKCFSCSNSLVSLVFLLRHYVGRDEINRNCVAMNSHHKIIILDNETILLNLFTHFLFDLVLLHHIASYLP